MTRFRLAIAFALVILSLLLASEVTAAARLVEIDSISITPGIWVKSNSCANGGLGEDVEFTAGTIVLVSNRAGNIKQVYYENVVGIGHSTGLSYEITYVENRSSDTSFTSRLTMQSTEALLVEMTMTKNGQATTRIQCK